jgi:hypothetical protein
MDNSWDDSSGCSQGTPNVAACVSTDVKVLPPDDCAEGGTPPGSPAENECKEEEAPQQEDADWDDRSDTGLGFKVQGFRALGLRA